MKIFPVGQHKRPLVAGGFHAASDDETQIAAWKTEFPGCNWAWEPASDGMCVVDIDPRKGGDETWEILCKQHGYPITRRVKTPSGGVHLYFNGVTASGTDKLGPGVDLKSKGGYVLIPGSRVGDKLYEMDQSMLPATLPAWIPETLAKTHREAIKVEAEVELDQQQNIEKARRHVEKLIREDDVAIEGSGGDTRTYRLAAYLGDLGLSLATAIAVAEPWNAACRPPWAEDEFAAKIEQGFKSRQNDIGAKAELSNAQIFGVGAGQTVGQPLTNPWRLYKVADLPELPEPRWLEPDLIPSPAVGVIYGPSQAGKTFVAISHALQLTSRGIKTAFMAGEGKRAVLHRAQAWMVIHGVETDLFRAFDEVPYVAEPGKWIAMCEAFKFQGFKPDLVIFDTASRLMRGLDQNSDKDAGALIEQCETLKRIWDCTILLIHHTGKDTARGSRGSSVFTNDVDFSLECIPETEANICSIHVRKQKEAAIKRKADHWRGMPVLGTLVYEPLDEAEFREMTDSSIKETALVAALTELGAKDGGDTTTHILAHHMAGPEASLEEQASMGRVLGQLGRGRFQAYRMGEKWSLP